MTHSSYAALDGVLYCKHHFARLFMEKGNYNHVLEAAAHKQNMSSAPTSPPPGPAPERTPAEPKPEPDDKPEEDQS